MFKTPEKIKQHLQYLRADAVETFQSTATICLAQLADAEVILQKNIINLNELPVLEAWEQTHKIRNEMLTEVEFIIDKSLENFNMYWDETVRNVYSAIYGIKRQHGSLKGTQVFHNLLDTLKGLSSEIKNLMQSESVKVSTYINTVCDKWEYVYLKRLRHVKLTNSEACLISQYLKESK